MTIEDVLRKRGSIILQLKQELAYISERWGVGLETIEIKNVRIMSAQVFANMQARFRDSVRLESETSSLETDKRIAESRYAQREQLALREQEFHRRELERKAETEHLAATASAALEALKQTQRKEAAIADFAGQIEVAAAEALKRQDAFRLEEQLLAVQHEVWKKQFIADTERKQHQVRLSEMDDSVTRRRIDTANQADAALALIRHLPAIAGALRVRELNITEDAVARLGRSLSDLLTGTAKA
jgi:hypothetical protein